MSGNNPKTSGRPRKNDTGSPVIADRAKLRRLKSVVQELMNEYQFTTHTLARYTIGEKRSSYISGIYRGKHLDNPPEIRPREDEYDSIMRLRAFIIQQGAVDDDIAALMMERFGLLGRVAEIDNQIYKRLKQKAMKQKLEGEQ